MLRRVLFAAIFIGAASAAWVAQQRWTIERANRTVEITVEWAEMRQLSSVFRIPIDTMLREFHSAGVTSIALQEQTIRQLVDDGKVFRPDPFTDARVRRLIGQTGDEDTPRTVLGFPDSELEKRVRQNLDVRWGKDRVEETSLDTMPALIIVGGYAEFRDIGVGLDPQALSKVEGAHLGVVARVRNYSGLTADELSWSLRDLRTCGAHAVIFSGDDVLGNPDEIHTTAEELERNNIAYGDVEFGKQHGAEKLTRALQGNYIRVHTIQGAELSNLTADAAVGRFVKAVRERTMRLLYIHLMSSVSGSSFDQDRDFIGRIARSVGQAGYSLGLARPMPKWRVSTIQFALISIGLVAAAAILTLDLWGSLPPLCVAYLLLLLGGLIAGKARDIILVSQAAALLSALVFPTLSLILARFPTQGDAPNQQQSGSDCTHPAACKIALLRLLGTSLFSLLGALFIVGFLGDTRFMTKTDEFIGIKPAIILPVLLVFAIYGGRFLDPGSASARWDRLKQRTATTLAQPLEVWHLVAFCFIVVLLGVLVARSGNDSAVGASMFEIKTRRVLDGVLIARPRTKEFLLGNPALYMAFYAAARGWKGAVLILVLLGSIGQTSLVNTFCHIHTPILISLFHVINGLWLGALVGWGMSILWNRRQSKSRSKNR